MNPADAARELQQLATAIRTGNRGSEQQLRRQLVDKSTTPDFLARAAQLYWQAGRIDDARDLFEDACQRFPQDARTWLTLAVFQCRQQEYAESLPLFEKAVTLAPDDALVRHRYGWALSTVGRTDAATEQLQRAVELDPLNAAAHYLLSTLREYQPDDPHIGQMRKALEQPLPPRRRSRLYFALGRALEQTAQYAESFDSYAEANRLRRGEFDYDIAAESAHVNWLIDNFSAAALAAAGGGYDSESPVFLVGMPRSGSTLLEHMLSCHADISAIGEKPLFLQSLNQHIGTTLMQEPSTPIPAFDDAAWRNAGRQYVEATRQAAGFKQRIVDKQLFNYYAIGAIALALPRAHIVYCTRDPRDMAVSCFTTAFREGRPWAYDLDELCDAWRQHRRLMTHWQQALPGRIFELKYEDLVDDPEAQLRQLLQHLGTDWSDRVLGFSDSDRPVETSSRGQVSRPLYADSVGRWQRFASQLEPYLDRLQA